MFFTHLLFEIGVQASIARSYIEFFIYYLIAINIITFIVYGIDKLKAKNRRTKQEQSRACSNYVLRGGGRPKVKGLWRIPEATLLLLAVIGGSIGAWLGMAIWHHKTKHLKFKYGVPAILIIQLALLIYIYIRY